MKSLGQRGEELAADRLQAEGYLIVARNWRCSRGEIDIIAKDGETLVFLEVKTRRSGRYGTPAEAVDTRKQEKVRQLARTFMYEERKTAPQYRFDVVTVDGDGNVTIIKNAF
jgi:putative endonuclease